MNKEMEETMKAIDIQDQPKPIVNRRDELITAISGLESDIDTAQKAFESSNEQETPLYTSISPEQANQNKKKMVFLKRDLAAKKTEYAELDQ